MSLLFPLFLAGTLAVAAPIVFHMIRRTPSGRKAFGSLMFLSESPPRFVRREKLEHVGLLLLRAAAVALLALAFARPFLPTDARIALEEGETGHVAILLDRSASMQRGDLWSRAKEEVGRALDGVPAGATSSLVTFARTPTTLLREARPERIREALATLEPGWEATDLGRALVATADELFAEAAESGRAARIVLVSDLQAGAAVPDLEDYDWPEGVELELRPVSATPGNASLQAAPGSETPGELSVRVTNSPDATSEDFRLQWVAGSPTSPTGEGVDVSCPAGESRVVRAPSPPGDSDVTGLLLTGDGVPFDNFVHHLAPPKPKTRLIAPAPDEGVEQDLGFFLESLFGDAALDPAGTAPDASEHSLLVMRLGEGAPAETLAFARAGGVVLVVLPASSDASGAGREEALRELLDVPSLSLGEAETRRGFSLLAEIAFEHPLFAPFDDPRYSDFTKIHFWHHRALELPESPDPDGPRVLARFDDGLPFLVERPVEGGRILVATSGWQAEDSDFARSTKFAPLLIGLTELSQDVDPALAALHVGDPVPLPAKAESIRGPDGRVVELAPGASHFRETTLPGPWELVAAGKTIPFLVRLDPSESWTEPMEGDLFARTAVSLSTAENPAEAASREERERQELGVEIEGRQKLWRWFLLAVLGTLLVETAWAGRLARTTAPDSHSPKEGT